MNAVLSWLIIRVNWGRKIQDSSSNFPGSEKVQNEAYTYFFSFFVEIKYKHVMQGYDHNFFVWSIFCSWFQIYSGNLFTVLSLLTTFPCVYFPSVWGQCLCFLVYISRKTSQARSRTQANSRIQIQFDLPHQIKHFFFQIQPAGKLQGLLLAYVEYIPAISPGEKKEEGEMREEKITKNLIIFWNGALATLN